MNVIGFIVIRALTMEYATSKKEFGFWGKNPFKGINLNSMINIIKVSDTGGCST